ncbi:MAG: ribonuclease J [Candidatus Paraimprobicoccus trichonymphae]|uniref:Ribonuclease J n=1 Tax=Candidatus Paraimprobicoccus trichonymphae TaxID=3033793 RepID=A0AA48KXT3_9FIRM|nr:MAG: ribonuclease J [Candidatus Paraimprobicoccus trichonymphae]
MSDLSVNNDGPRAVSFEPNGTGYIRKNIIKIHPKVKVIFLGGLNQIGKNITLFEYNNEIFILDCGMAFPDSEMFGIDLVIPDFSYLVSNKNKISGLIVTHGHEDHIGAIPYLLNKINIPIYGTALTIGLIQSKLKERRMLGNAKLNTITVGQSIILGNFKIEFIHVNHSIPDAVGLAIHSPAGIIVHTGDFKIDCTPARGEMIDLAKFAEFGKRGVLALMADSTNADRDGYTATEKIINQSFENLFQKAGNKRIVIATFASNIGRIKQIIDCAIKYKRKVAFSGRSMLNYIAIAKQLNYIEVPDAVIIDIELVTKYTYSEIVLVSTGSQGEPMSALYRMAYSEHKKITVGPNDFIIISATPIPGNEKTVNSIINELMKLGCEVIHESMYEIHVSGHACQEELKIIHGLVKPKYFIPVHGEFKHLRKHAEIAKNMGTPSENIYVGNSGDVIEISQKGIKKVSEITLEPIYVDGSGVGDVGSIVLNDRKHLGQDGLIVSVVTLNRADKHIVSGPDIVSRGFVYVKESEKLIREARYTVTKAIEFCIAQNTKDWNNIRTKIRDDLYKLFYSRTKRNPVILPVIMEV